MCISCSQMNSFHTKFMLSLYAAADARGFHLTEDYKIGTYTIILSSRSVFILHLNTSVLMNICINNLSLQSSFLLKITLVNGFDIFIIHFPEIVAFCVVQTCDSNILCDFYLK